MTFHTNRKNLLIVGLALFLAAWPVLAQDSDATSSASTVESDQQAAAEAEVQPADATTAASAQEGGATESTAPAPARPLMGINLYDLALGPLFITAWTLFALGFAWRVGAFLRLTRPFPAPARALVFPGTITVPNDLEFLVGGKKGLWRVFFHARRWVRRTIFGTNPVMGPVSLVFHILLFLVPLLLPAHNGLLMKSLGVSFPSLPEPLMDTLTLVLLAFGGFFLLRRILVPRVRALTTLRDYLVLLLVAAPFLSAYMAHHHWLDYHTLVLVHMLVGDAVIAAIPFTKLGHMPFLILSRFFAAGEYAWKPGNRRW